MTGKTLVGTSVLKVSATEPALRLLEVALWGSVDDEGRVLVNADDLAVVLGGVRNLEQAVIEAVVREET